jgi:branched-subunit amino acid transport protein
MDQKTITLTILAMGVVTYLPRLLPVLALKRGQDRGGASPLVEAWLRHIPVAVLAALLLPSLAIAEGQISLTLDNLYPLAAIPTLWVAWKTRSLLWSILTGVGVVALSRLLLG